MRFHGKSRGYLAASEYQRDGACGFPCRECAVSLACCSHFPVLFSQDQEAFAFTLKVGQQNCGCHYYKKIPTVFFISSAANSVECGRPIASSVESAAPHTGPGVGPTLLRPTLRAACSPKHYSFHFFTLKLTDVILCAILRMMHASCYWTLEFPEY